MEISIEIVPRSAEDLLQEVRFVEQNISQISTINIPDLLRFDIRAWDACALIKDTRFRKIAHIRAIDFNVNYEFPLTTFIRENNIDAVLIIQGDPPPVESSAPIYPTSTIDLVKKLKNEIPELPVYGAFDPYRNNIRYELEYLKQKVDAGIDGFLSQPFFDLRLLEIYSEYLEGKEVYWGVSPVVSERSKTYWETRNRAIFPKHFEPTLEWNVNFGKEVLAFCQKNDFNLYLMPIKVDIEKYLKGLFE